MASPNVVVEFNSPSNTWMVQHNLGRFVTVDAFIYFEGKLTKILPYKVVHMDLNTVKVEFTEPFVGIVKVV